MKSEYYVTKHHDRGAGRQEKGVEPLTLSDALALVGREMPEAPPSVWAIDIVEARTAPPPPGPQNPPGADIALRVERTDGGPWRVSHRTRWYA